MCSSACALIGGHCTLTHTTTTFQYSIHTTFSSLVRFYGGRKTGVPGEKPSKQGRERTDKLKSHVIPGPGIEPGTDTEVTDQGSHHSATLASLILYITIQVYKTLNIV